MFQSNKLGRAAFESLSVSDRTFSSEQMIKWEHKNLNRNRGHTYILLLFQGSEERRLSTAFHYSKSVNVIVMYFA